MAAPRLDDHPTLPSAAEIAEARSEVEAGLAKGERPTLLTGMHAGVLAWGELLAERDRERPGIPQRISGDDLARTAVEPGQSVVVSGRLDALVDAPVAGRAEGYSWLSVALDAQQFVIVLAPATGLPELVLNGETAALGRYLGRIDLGSQLVPLVLARSVEPVVAVESTPPAYLAEFQGGVRIPEGLYADIDDERPLIETRPYYFTIGQVKTELDSAELWNKALDANANANELHQRPNDFRGRVCTLRGIVYQVWKDEGVAADHPFDVRTVTRVMLYKRDTGPISEDGKIAIKSVLRLYELALVGEQPVPKPGEFIEADGRFLKWRAIPVSSHPEFDRLRGVKRQSSKAYTMFFVAAQWRPAVIPTIDWRPIKIGISVFAGLFFVLIVVWLKRERGVERRLQSEVARLRQGRRALKSRPARPPLDSSTL